MKWTSIGSVSRIRVATASVESVSSWIGGLSVGTMSAHAFNFQFVANPLITLALAAAALFVSMTIFELYCPSDIQTYKSFDEFHKNELLPNGGLSLLEKKRAEELEKEIRRKIISSHLNVDKEATQNIVDIILETRDVYTPGNTRDEIQSRWDEMDTSHPKARFVTSLLLYSTVFFTALTVLWALWTIFS